MRKRWLTRLLGRQLCRWICRRSMVTEWLIFCKGSKLVFRSRRFRSTRIVRLSGFLGSKNTNKCFSMKLFKSDRMQLKLNKNARRKKRLPNQPLTYQNQKMNLNLNPTMTPVNPQKSSLRSLSASGSVNSTLLIWTPRITAILTPTTISTLWTPLTALASIPPRHNRLRAITWWSGNRSSSR